MKWPKLIKKVLIGEVPYDYSPPNPRRLAARLSGSPSLVEDSQSGFLMLSMESDNPELSIELIMTLVAETDQFIKERFVAYGAETLSFYHKKLSASRSREHRDILARLIASEEQKLMLASREGPFVVEIMTGPSISLRPTSPKGTHVIIFGLVFGFFLGASVVLLRKRFSS